jgi:probable HAF family extracellular repeat protein
MHELAQLASAMAIDASGRIAGTRAGWSEARAVLWGDGEMRDLGTLGGEASFPFAMNSAGTVVGMSTNAEGRMDAFVWEGGTMRALETLGGASMALDLNESGQIVGMSADGSGVWHAVLWENGGVRDLGTFGTNRSGAVGIDEDGRILVHVQESGEHEASRIVLLDGDRVVDLSSTTTMRGPHGATDIEGNSGIVGAIDKRAFVWNGGAPRLLPYPESCIEAPADRDGDGVGEELDRCPRTAPSVVVDSQGCAVDTDGDQVPDGLDECAGTPAGVFVDVNGCPIER